jgi:uncharacterized protein YndB with AHSA1/START domain
MRSFMSRLVRLSLWLLVLAVIAVGVIFWTGGRTRSFVSKTTIAAPKELVFQFLTDPEKQLKWTAGGATVRPTSEGGHRKGATSHIVVNREGMHWELDSEILETLENERLITAINGSPFDGRSDFQLQEREGATELQHTLVVRPKGWLRLLAPFSQKQIQAKLDEGVAQFRQAIEQVARESQSR